MLHLQLNKRNGFVLLAFVFCVFLLVTNHWNPRDLASNLKYDYFARSEYENVVKNENKWLGKNLSKEKEDEREKFKAMMTPVYTFRCNESIGCVRELLKENEEIVQPEVCWLTCGSFGALWPKPAQAKLGSCLTSFSANDISFETVVVPGEEPKRLLLEMWNIFESRLEKIQESFTGKESSKLHEQENKILVNVDVSENDAKISLDTDESFSITIESFPALTNKETCNQPESSKVNVRIVSKTVFGTRHALETLVQLIAFDNSQKKFKIVNSVEIKDKPIFPYRGILIDTSRNFIPIHNLKGLIEGMSHSKLNILHLHLTDSNSFSFFSKQLPKMTQYGAYSMDKVYYPNDIEELLQFALIHGVKVIPELDAPAHAGNGWQWGPSEGLGELSLCINAEPWRSFCGQPPCGQLNPLNPNTYSVLEKLYQDFLEVFDQDIFHMGGDEVYRECWESNKELASFIRNGSYIDLWGSFQKQAFERLQKVKTNSEQTLKAIVWTSGMTATKSGRKFLDPSNYIIQIWDGKANLVRDLLDEGYQLIMSNVENYYLDQGAGTWLGTDHVYTYRLWQSFYDVKLSQYIKDFEADTQKPGSQRQLLGGEAALWSEKVNSQNMETKIWPRAAAAAENLWSNPSRRSPLVYSRLNHHNRRLISLGIHSNQLQPEWCYFNGHCDDPHHKI